MEAPLLLTLGAAVSACCGAGLDPQRVTLFRGDARGGFGYSLVPFGPPDDGGLLVGAPLHPGPPNPRGAIYSCRYRSGGCEELSIKGPPNASDSSLGLALAAGGSRALACGPRVPLGCGTNLQLRGSCVLLGSDLRPLQRLPHPPPGCPRGASDVVFLIDGSGSIRPPEFGAIKSFVREMMGRLGGQDTQFALSQFSQSVLHHFDFNDFRGSRDPSRLLRGVAQIGGTTHTASAIRKVLTEVFLPARGARAGAQRILVVITDGRKFDDPLGYGEVLPLARSMGVARYAIGVGSAFQDPSALGELRTIASSPPEDHVFRVDNFNALQSIQSQLQEKLFAIEGTQSARSSSFQLEMAQEGFSALLTPEGAVLGAVGAYGWSGGVFVYGGAEEPPTFLNVSQAAGGDMSDAYLGYAAESLSLGGRRVLALGAPRYRHVGRLLLFLLPGPGAGWELLAQATGTQVGSYFGGSLCALDPDGDGSAEVLLVGTPLSYGAGGGGHVEVCGLSLRDKPLRCQQTLRGHPGHPLGRFGAALAPLGDVTGDGWPEVAVGAPLEDGGHGAVYVFRGEEGGVSPRYSQRIPGAGFPSRPRFFGGALGGGRDLSGDRLPDLAVGAQGQVLLLRSQPLLRLQVTVTFQPREVPAAAGDCQGGEGPQGEVAKATLCFLGSKRTPDNFGRHLSVTLRYQATLDPGRVMVRGVFTPGATPTHNGTLRLGVEQQCQSLGIAFRGCPQDTLTPVGLRVTYEVTGEPIEGAGGLRPALSEDTELVATGTLPFEQRCGADNICTDDLQLSLNFSGLETLVVGARDALDVTLTLGNAGEDAHGARVQLQHPRALSYRRATLLQSSHRSPSLQCNSEPPSGPRRATLCLVNHPIFRPGAEVTFTVTLDVPHGAELGAELEVVANATSANPGSGGSVVRAAIPVKYGVFLILTSTPSSTRYLKVPRGAGGGGANVTHHYEVKVLGSRGPPFNVTFLVPGGGRLWDRLEVTPLQPGVSCHPLSQLQGPPDGAGQLLGCPLPPCAELLCRVPPLDPPRVLGFSLGGSLALGWMRESRQHKVLVQSWARVAYDGGRYWSGEGAPQLEIQTEVELLDPPNTLPLILGGTVGGLLLLALVVLALYKVGFFKRRYKDMMGGAETPTAPLGEPQE